MFFYKIIFGKISVLDSLFILLPMYIAAISHVFHQMYIFNIAVIITLGTIAIKSFFWIFGKAPTQEQAETNPGIVNKSKTTAGGILIVVLAVFGLVVFFMSPSKLISDLSPAENMEETTAKNVPGKVEKKEDTEAANKEKNMEYERFTDKSYGFSFDYPKTLPALVQGNSNNGKAATGYTIHIDDKCTGYVSIEFTSDKVIDILADMRKAAREFNDGKTEKLASNAYEVKYAANGNNHIRKVYLILYNGEVQRQYIDFAYNGGITTADDDVVKHIIESFQPKQ